MSINFDESGLPLINAIEKEIGSLSEELQTSGLALAAITLAYRLAEASPRDTASIARELRTTLNELRELDQMSSKEDDPIDTIQNRRSNSDLSDGTS